MVFIAHKGHITEVNFLSWILKFLPQVSAVGALMKEKADEYNWKYGLSAQPVKYLSESVRAKSLLEPDVIRHIERCFTRTGMREAKRGPRKPRKRQMVQVPRDKEILDRGEASKAKVSEVEFNNEGEEEPEAQLTEEYAYNREVQKIQDQLLKSNKFMK